MVICRRELKEDPLYVAHTRPHSTCTSVRVPHVGDPVYAALQYSLPLLHVQKYGLHLIWDWNFTGLMKFTGSTALELKLQQCRKQLNQNYIGKEQFFLSLSVYHWDGQINETFPGDIGQLMLLRYNQGWRMVLQYLTSCSRTV